MADDPLVFGTRCLEIGARKIGGRGRTRAARLRLRNVGLGDFLDCAARLRGFDIGR